VAGIFGADSTLMKNRDFVKKEIIRQGLLPLFFHADARKSISILQALYRAGVRIAEFTNRGSEALENFTALLKIRDQEMPDLVLGVGTVKNLKTASLFLNAGADFLVSPNTDAELIQYATVHDFFHIPGCMTPTEIAVAENSGADFIKLFPGNLLGPEFLNSVREIFPALHFMPTGGVEPNADSITQWFSAGASAVGMGSRLVSKYIMQSGDYDALEQNAAKLLEIISALKRS
jgi:2-dehydro-3-deoxyphosphogluconate aldolase/(4S)-4-hydroxy-2-oxoglutarate aldolase